MKRFIFTIKEIDKSISNSQNIAFHVLKLFFCQLLLFIILILLYFHVSIAQVFLELFLHGCIVLVCVQFALKESLVSLQLGCIVFLSSATVHDVRIPSLLLCFLELLVEFVHNLFCLVLQVRFRLYHDVEKFCLHFLRLFRSDLPCRHVCVNASCHHVLLQLFEVVAVVSLVVVHTCEVSLLCVHHLLVVLVLDKRNRFLQFLFLLLPALGFLLCRLVGCCLLLLGLRGSAGDISAVLELCIVGCGGRHGWCICADWYLDVSMVKSILHATHDSISHSAAEFLQVSPSLLHCIAKTRKDGVKAVSHLIHVKGEKALKHLQQSPHWSCNKLNGIYDDVEGKQGNLPDRLKRKAYQLNQSPKCHALVIKVDDCPQ